MFVIAMIGKVFDSPHQPRDDGDRGDEMHALKGHSTWSGWSPVADVMTAVLRSLINAPGSKKARTQTLFIATLLLITVRNYICWSRKNGIATSTKPTFYLHVGLHKTGTSFLQHALSDNYRKTAPVLLKDNLVYLGTSDLNNKQFVGHGIQSIFSEHIDPSDGYLALTQRGRIPELHDESYNFTDNKNFISRIQELRNDTRDIIMVYEVASLFTDQMIERLKQLLLPTWNVKVLVVHRFFHEWLFSFHNQVHKLLVEDIHEWTKQVMPFDMEHNPELDSRQLFSALEKSRIHPARLVQQVYQRHFQNVHVVSLEELKSYQQKNSPGDALLEYLMCHFIPGATYSCDLARQGILDSPIRNEQRDPTFDLIAQKANRQRLVPDDAERLTVAHWIKQYLTEFHNQSTVSTSTWPHICPSNKTLQRFEHVSAQLDRSLHSKFWTPERQRDHHASFERLLTKNKMLCYVDAKAVLGQHEALRSMLKDKSETKENIKAGLHLTKSKPNKRGS